MAKGIGAFSTPSNRTSGLLVARNRIVPPMPHPISMKDICCFWCSKSWRACHVLRFVRYNGTRSPPAFQKTARQIRKAVKYSHAGSANELIAYRVMGKQALIRIHQIGNLKISEPIAAAINPHSPRSIHISICPAPTDACGSKKYFHRIITPIPPAI